MQWPFIPGRDYNRRQDIHAAHGGQQQGGISTPAKAPGIFLFTGSSGKQHGYADLEHGDGSYSYTGEGQRGDMEMLRGNAAIRDHAKNGKDLLLFQNLGHGRPVRFVGLFVCAGWSIQRQPDQDGQERNAIVFSLMPAQSILEALAEALPNAANSAASLAELRANAIAASTVTAQAPKNSVMSVFIRSKAIRDYALARANGSCERCESSAPFKTKRGLPFLEVHHIRRLSDGGPDQPEFVAAVCPNCHREAHHGLNADAVNQALLEKVGKMEAHPAHH